MPTQSRFRLKWDKNDVLRRTHLPSIVSGHYWSLLALRPKKKFLHIQTGCVFCEVGDET